MKRTFFLAGLALLVVAACNKTPENEQPVDFSKYSLRVEPVITRVTETDFESGDAIGLCVERSGNVYAANEQLTYDGSAFSGKLNWYEKGDEECTLKAYYPYKEGETLPTRFSVQADQSKGTALSDFVSAVKEHVLPSANAVPMVFKHQMSRLILTVKNNSGSDIDNIRLEEILIVTNVGEDLTVKVDENAKWQPITPYLKDDKYYAIVPGQTVAPIVAVTIGEKKLSQQLAEVTLEPGKQYSVSIVVNKDELKVVLAGDIENWTDGGELIGGPEFHEYLEDGYFTYDNTRYSVAKMKDGKWWMTQNMRYVPEGIEVSDDLTKVTAGVFYPLVLKEDLSAAEFSRDITVINARGYLYQAEVALGLKVGDLTTLAAAQALEGTQGLCPKGWHVPTTADILALVGKGAQLTTNPDAPYYNGADGSIALLNADGFNMEAYGAITIQDNTKTTGTFMGRMANYDHLTSGMFCGSSVGVNTNGTPSVTYNTAGDETSGIKNIQFNGLMPMTNKASADQYTCNGTKVSYRIAAPLRCVRND